MELGRPNKGTPGGEVCVCGAVDVGDHVRERVKFLQDFKTTTCEQHAVYREPPQ